MTDDAVARERSLVRTGWELVDLLGQLETEKSRRLLRARWDSERARATATLTPLETGGKVGPRALRSYQGPSVQTRFRRTIDYLRPGERVFEIGPGRGYLAGLLLRDGRAGAYHGVDLVEDNLVATRELLTLNHLADRAELEIRNLYDLTRADLEAFGADLLVCCEVIEHVPDPEQALKTLAAALPAGADLLISVPLLGRLEDIWGHLAIFNAARIRDMVEHSGLTVHAVDVVDNVWVFVLASHQAGPSARAAAAAAAATSALSELDTPTAMRAIRLDNPEITLSPRAAGAASQELTATEPGLVYRLAAGRRLLGKAPATGGIRIPAPAAARGIRLELAVEGLDDVVSCELGGYAGETQICRWRWNPAERRPRKSPATFVIRPGRGGHFTPVEPGPVQEADAFELTLTVRPGAAARLLISRAAFVV